MFHTGQEHLNPGCSTQTNTILSYHSYCNYGYLLPVLLLLLLPLLIVIIRTAAIHCDCCSFLHALHLLRPEAFGSIGAGGVRVDCAGYSFDGRGLKLLQIQSFCGILRSLRLKF